MATFKTYSNNILVTRRPSRLPCVGILALYCSMLLLHCSVRAQQIDTEKQDFLIRNYDCNYYQDTCRIEWQLDGACDMKVELYGCSGKDCWDCDPCAVYDYTSCDECTRAGMAEDINGDNNHCFWCPGDGLCRSQALGPSFWDTLPTTSTTDIPRGSTFTSCPQESDWKASSDSCQDFASKQNDVFTDPLYGTMTWIYDLIDLPKVWRQGITGAGVHVRINDDGMDANHAEFIERMDGTQNCPAFRSDPSPNSFHGTAVASILAAQANNDVCAVGIAPGVTLSACTFSATDIEADIVDMLATQQETVDISSNSWGPDVCFNLNSGRRQRHERRAQQSTNGNDIDNETAVTMECLFDPNHTSSPCDICDSSNLQSYLEQTPVDGIGIQVSSACMFAIDDYCTSHYRNDPVACAEFLDFYVQCEYHALPPEAHQVFLEGVLQGRQGKGIIYVFAGGNSYTVGGVTNTDGFVNSRFTIGVGAVDKEGKHAGYSTTGSALLVVAPGGDLGPLTNLIVASPGGGCGEISAGTSFSAPVVSGVVALMLEVNSGLGWRDVQAILVETASQTDPSDSSWTINNSNGDGDGLHVSDKYGFGLVNASAAVEASRSWTYFGPELQLVLKPDEPLDMAIADNANTPTSHSQLVETSEDFRTESVVVYLDLLHAARGDLLITLTSPRGTESILHPSRRPENRQLPGNETWKLMTVRNWNESPVGEWKLSIVDEYPGTRETCANEPFEYLLQNSGGSYDIYNCLDAEARFHCRNGQVRNEELVAELMDRSRNNLTAATACCVCGGGVPVSDVNVLRSWTMVIYGHDSMMTNDDEIVDVAEDTLVAKDTTTEPPGTPPSSETDNGAVMDDTFSSSSVLTPLSPLVGSTLVFTLWCVIF